MFFAALFLGADPDRRHFHDGKLARYQMGPPSLLLSAADEAKLKTGAPVMQTLLGEDGARRMISVQDIQAPADVVMGRIVDFEKYDQMVQGVESCVNYVSTEQQDGLRLMKSRYTIQAAHLKVTYFMEHLYDPVNHCMVFNLDYGRQSDIDDSVGYWYAQPHGPAACRLFYSTECKLRGWVPGPVYSILTKKALGQATVWVSAEALKEWSAMQRGVLTPQQRFVRFVADARAGRLQMPPLPALPQMPQMPQPRSAISRGGRAAVRFVNAIKTPKRVIPMI